MPPKGSKSLETVTNLSTTAPFTCTPPSAGLHDPSFTGPHRWSHGPHPGHLRSFTLATLSLLALRADASPGNH